MSIDALEISDDDGTPERLFLFSMENGTNWGYVNSTSNAFYNSIIYTPAVIDMDDISQALSEDSPTMSIRIEADAAVAQQFVPYQPLFPIRVRVYRHHFDDLDNEFKVEMIGEVINASFDEEEGMCVMQCRMVASNLDRRVPWPVYQKPCNYALYGPGCRVNKDLYRTDTNVVGILSNTISSPDFGAAASTHSDPRWFVNGWAEVFATGESRFIIGQTGDTLILQTPFITLEPNGIVRAFAGCDRSRQTCLNKFNNLDRHFGFPWPSQKNPFTDNVYGTGAPG